MQKIFQNSKESLFDRADNIIKLSAFDITTLKDIMYDHNPLYSNDDLLALYTFTGGVPKYIELFCDNGVVTMPHIFPSSVQFQEDVTLNLR